MGKSLLATASYPNEIKSASPALRAYPPLSTVNPELAIQAPLKSFF
jgi:hypothetical protein